jgi:pimeloyl-ACP methyl ester carboxylesterase
MSVFLYTLFALHSIGTGQVIDSVICKADPTQSYALYVPAKGMKEALPIIYFFDPHADGALPLKKYKSLADTYGFILAGSNNSKNGNDWSVTANILRQLFDDTRRRLKIDNRRIYTCGFSGGAKVAGYTALQHPEVKGVIAGGAGLPDGTPAGDFPFSFTAIAGEADMNMTELVGITSGLDHTKTRHRIIFFDGKHEWSPVATMNLAFAGLQFDAMRESTLPRDAALIERYASASKKRLDAYVNAGQFIKAVRECTLSIGLLDGLSAETGWFREKAAALTKNPSYQKQRQTEQDLLTTEQNTKAEYMQHFQQDDMNYWMTTIRDLQSKANPATAKGAMYQRLLAYLSLAFYSISNQLINGNQNNVAHHFVELYKMADPTNSEAWYFSAILDARDNQTPAAENDLVKAASCGFRDRDRLLAQPEFKNESFVRILKGRLSFLK